MRGGGGGGGGFIPHCDGYRGLLGHVPLVLAGSPSHHHITITQFLCRLLRETWTTLTV